MEWDVCGFSQSAAMAGRREWIFFCEEYREPPEALEEAVRQAGGVYAAFEPRTLPWENGKYYDPVTLETEWLGACFAVRRSAFVKAGGFGRASTSADAAAELSRRLRAQGEKMRYVPEAVVETESEPPLPPDGVFVRAGNAFRHVPPRGEPRFTVVIRTYQRPDVLRLTLESLRWQTYRQFVVIVVEDGETPVSGTAVREAQEWLHVEYVAACAHWGRCRAGNEGVARAKTEYVCFLDDDDYWFAEHLEVMARAIEERPECGLWCAMAVEGRCAESVRAEFGVKTNMGKSRLRAADFCADNPVPIQAVVFRKTLYEACGGLDVRQDALEDWDLWLRMICRAPVAGVAKATSIYRVPSDPAVYEKRRAGMEIYRAQLLEKMREYRPPLSAREIYELYWRLDDAVKEQKEKPLDRAAWYEKARAMSDSTLWKLSAPLRRILAAVGRGAGKAAGPAAPDWNNAAAQELYLYCHDIERSIFWKMFRRLRK